MFVGRSVRCSAAAVILLVTACSGKSSLNDGTSIANIAVSGVPSALVPGGSAQLSATVTDVAGDVVQQPVTWNSNHSSVVTVSTGGLVTAVSVGTATITAQSGGKAGSATITVNHAAPSITAITPDSVTAGSAAFTLTVAGAGFDQASNVQWNGSARPTTFVNNSTLTAQITAADVATPASIPVTVSTPQPGGGTSGPVAFTVAADNPEPVLTTLAPSNVIVGSATFALAVGGSGFVPLSTVEWNGSALTTTFVSDTELTAQIPASDLTIATTVPITVVNPAPGGGASGAKSFTILATPASIMSVSVGYAHTCAISSTGHLYCWGDNTLGQLGDGHAEPYSATPVPVVTGLTFTSVTASDNYSCAISTAGDGYCWGQSFTGELGNGVSAVVESTPQLVLGGLHFTTIAAGGDHACGLIAGGAAYCWGNDLFGELGNGSTTEVDAPTPVEGGLHFTTITSGDAHSCGLTSTGAAYCWGNNVSAELGDGTTTDRLVPTPVQGGLTFTAISANSSEATCGIASSGAAYCWGANAFDFDATADAANPVRLPSPVRGGLLFQSISAGAFGGCGVAVSGTGYCWGDGDDGNLGDGMRDETTAPKAIAGGYHLAQISAPIFAHACATTTDGLAVCWGEAGSGDLGDGATEFRTVPTAVAGGHTFTSIAPSREGACALDVAQKVWCWGSNVALQLGADQNPSPPDAPVSLGTGLAFSALGQSNAGPANCGLTPDQSAWCWGDNGFGQLGDGTTGGYSATPVAVSGGYHFVMMSNGTTGTCGVRTDGPLMCWGSGDNLGIGASAGVATPTVAGGPTMTTVSVGYNFACALATGGGAWCWGANSSGNLGDGTTTEHDTPMPVSGGLAFRTISAGFSAACGVTADSTGYCWGSGVITGGATQSDVPVIVGGGLKFVTIQVGTTACGLTAAGAVYCWGANLHGEIGDGTVGTAATMPTLVSGNNVYATIGAGDQTMCGITTTGIAMCWGANDNGKLGIGASDVQVTPMQTTGSVFRWLVPHRRTTP